MGEILDYLATLWRVIGKALWLEPDLLAAAGAAVDTATAPRAFALAIGVVLLAGVSSLVGQSTALFINRVPRSRFVLSLVLNAVLLVGGWLVWALVLWLVGRVLFPVTPIFQTLLLLVALSYAPLVFGFLILIPWLGTFIQRLLYTWSYIIAVGAVMHEFQVRFILALITVGLGWLVLLGLTLTIGRPITALHNILWHRIAGSQLDATAQDILMQYTRQPPASPDRGDTP